MRRRARTPWRHSPRAGGGSKKPGRAGPLVRSVVTSQQPIAPVCPCINLMQAASPCATRTAITAAEVFEMQYKDPRTLRISGELVLRLWVSAHMRQSVTNLCGQATDVLRIQSGVQEVQGTTSECR